MVRSVVRGKRWRGRPATKLGDHLVGLNTRNVSHECGVCGTPCGHGSTHTSQLNLHPLRASLDAARVLRRVDSRYSSHRNCLRRLGKTTSLENCSSDLCGTHVAHSGTKRWVKPNNTWRLLVLAAMECPNSLYFLGSTLYCSELGGITTNTHTLP